MIDAFSTAVKDSGNRLWLVTTGALVFIDPARIPGDTVFPPVARRCVRVDRRSIETDVGAQLPVRTKSLEIVVFENRRAHPARYGTNRDHHNASRRGSLRASGVFAIAQPC